MFEGIQRLIAGKFEARNQELPDCGFGKIWSTELRCGVKNQTHPNLKILPVMQSTELKSLFTPPPRKYRKLQALIRFRTTPFFSQPLGPRSPFHWEGVFEHRFDEAQQIYDFKSRTDSIEGGT